MPEVDEMLKQKICWQRTDLFIAHSAHKAADTCWDKSHEATITVLCHGIYDDSYILYYFEQPKVFCFHLKVGLLQLVLSSLRTCRWLLHRYGKCIITMGLSLFINFYLTISLNTLERNLIHLSEEFNFLPSLSCDCGRGGNYSAAVSVSGQMEVY